MYPAPVVGSANLLLRAPGDKRHEHRLVLLSPLSGGKKPLGAAKNIRPNNI